MATKVTCDRCSKDLTMTAARTREFIVYSLGTEHRVVRKTVDLCDNCIKDFTIFMNIHSGGVGM